MIQRIGILLLYFLRTFVFSLVGLLFLLAALVYWAVFFPPGQATPDFENYVLLIGAFGAAATFLATVTIAGRANRLENYPFVARLQSRVEYLVAVLLAALIAGGALQLLVGGLALVRGPDLTTAGLLSIGPIWLALNTLAAVLALHATDLVASGWSRVIVFGLLAVLLVLNSIGQSPESWFADRLNDVAVVFGNMNLVFFADLFDSTANLFRGDGLGVVSSAAGIVFWPFRSISDAVFSGSLSPAQALAPAVLLLYGTILFLIAANLFVSKDLEFSE